jgi:hypothetical protein
MKSISFSHRFGNQKGRIIDNEFPLSARIALSYLFIDLKEKRYLESEKQVLLE